MAHRGNAVIVLGLSIIIAGCATELTKEGAAVSLLTSGDQAARCQSLGVIAENKRSGVEKMASATKIVLNKAAVMGADSVFIVSSNADLLDGATVVANAYKCR